MQLLQERSKLYRQDHERAWSIGLAMFFFGLAMLVFWALVSLNSCATWKRSANQSLRYAETLGNVAADAAKTVCMPAVDRCEKERINNPCAYLEQCIANTATARKAIVAYVKSVEAAWVAISISDASGAMDTVGKVLQTAGEIRSILATWGVDLSALSGVKND